MYYYHLRHPKTFAEDKNRPLATSEVFTLSTQQTQITLLTISTDSQVIAKADAAQLPYSCFRAERNARVSFTKFHFITLESSLLFQISLKIPGRPLLLLSFITSHQPRILHHFKVALISSWPSLALVELTRAIRTYT